MSVLAGRGCSEVQAEAITQRICFIIENDMMPINMVDGEGFRELLKCIEPG